MITDMENNTELSTIPAPDYEKVRLGIIVKLNALLRAKTMTGQQQNLAASLRTSLVQEQGRSLSLPSLCFLAATNFLDSFV
jgi:hypothetical protein